MDTALPDKYTLEMAPMVLRTVASRFHYDELRSGAPSQMLGEELQKLVTSAGVQAPPMLADVHLPTRTTYLYKYIGNMWIYLASTSSQLFSCFCFAAQLLFIHAPTCYQKKQSSTC